MIASSSKTVTALTSRSVSTTSWVGRIGVRFASTRKVTSADNSASATATTPRMRASRPGAGAAAVASSAVAAWPTFVMYSERPVRNHREAARHTLNERAPSPPMLAKLRLLYNNVAELRQESQASDSYPPECLSYWTETPGYRGRGSSCAAYCG